MSDGLIIALVIIALVVIIIISIIAWWISTANWFRRAIEIPLFYNMYKLMDVCIKLQMCPTFRV